jgi:hypothetical protein
LEFLPSGRVPRPTILGARIFTFFPLGSRTP